MNITICPIFMVVELELVHIDVLFQIVYVVSLLGFDLFVVSFL